VERFQNDTVISKRKSKKKIGVPFDHLIFQLQIAEKSKPFVTDTLGLYFLPGCGNFYCII